MAAPSAYPNNALHRPDTRSLARPMAEKPAENLRVRSHGLPSRKLLCDYLARRLVEKKRRQPCHDKKDKPNQAR